MRITILAFFTFWISISSSFSQTKTLEYLEDEYESSFKLVLYYSTLKIFSNQSEESFYDLIKDIEKVFILRMDDVSDEINLAFFEDIDNRIGDEGYEELLNMRSSDTWTAFYIKEKQGRIAGLFLVLMEEGSINCVDLKGYVPVDKISELVNKVDFNSIDKLF